MNTPPTQPTPIPSVNFLSLVSDERILRNVGEFSAEDARNILGELGVRSYNVGSSADSAKRIIGLVGQQVERISPHLTKRTPIPIAWPTLLVVVASSEEFPTTRLGYLQGGDQEKAGHGLVVGDQITVRYGVRTTIARVAHVHSEKEFSLDGTIDAPLGSQVVILNKTLNDFISVDHIQLISVLIRSVQDLQERVAQLSVGGAAAPVVPASASTILAPTIPASTIPAPLPEVPAVAATTKKPRAPRKTATASATATTTPAPVPEPAPAPVQEPVPAPESAPKKPRAPRATKKATVA